jgi:hypothetical protein
MVREFLKRIESEGARRRGSLIGTANPIWLSVSKGAVAQLLRRFKAHPRNVTFRGEDLAEFLEATNEPKLGSWDVVVPSGTGEPWSLLPSLVTKLQKRVVTVSPSGEVLVSGKSARVGSRGVEREGMDAALVRQAEDEYRAGKDARQSIPDRVYRAKRERPLLLIHCIEAHKRVEGQKEPVPVPAAAEQFIALALSFPQFDDTQATKKVTYKVNVVEWRSLFEDEVEEEEDDSNLELA